MARREGIRVIGHAVAHVEEFLYNRANSSRDFAQIEPQIPDLARSMAQAGIWLMPNFTAYKIIGLQARDLNAVLARPEMRFLPRSVREGWGPATNPYTARFGPDAYPRFMARYELLESWCAVSGRRACAC